MEREKNLSHVYCSVVRAGLAAVPCNNKLVGAWSERGSEAFERGLGQPMCHYLPPL
jgi:hypothetical protein